ncbi:MAG: CHAT domain-containing protein [Myxococcales bacterium]|nr:CHAT domain-containing protein [Myxococcales bacterium]
MRLVLEFHRSEQADDPFPFRVGRQQYVRRTAGGGAETAILDWDDALLQDLALVQRPGCDPAIVQRVGDRIQRFMAQTNWSREATELAAAVDRHEPVRITLLLNAAELYALPWELLTFKGSGQHIGALPGVTFHYEWPDTRTTPEQPSPRPEGGRILLAWSAAGGAVPAAEHEEAIAKACKEGSCDSFDPSKDVLAHASVERLLEKLQAAANDESFSVLHILCHGSKRGSTFGLALDGADPGDVDVVDGDRLGRVLSPHAARLRLVVLCACDSANAGEMGNHLGSVAQALHRADIQAVVASRFPLSVAGSVRLTDALYTTLLGEPGSLESAIGAARQRLLPMAELDWASVQHYARHADGDDTRPVVFRPYRGLLAFQLEHRRFFFGRDAEIAEVLRDLQALVDRKQPRFLVVAGASGTGKSSLVFAGAVPRLLAANPELTFLKMRPGSNPEAALNDALSKRSAQQPALLVVDQFEELFTQTASPADRQAFVRRLWSLASSAESGLRIIITLRVDFIGRCGELVVDDAGRRLDRIAYDEQHRVFVAQLGPEELRTTVEEPARKAGLELQAGLADRIVQAVGAEPGALPLLEDVLDVLWQKRRDRTLTQSAYDSLGGVVGALQNRADAIVNELPPTDRALVQRLLTSLVAVADDTTLDSRQRVAVAELRQSVAAADASGFDRVLKALVDARLLVVDDNKQSPTVEVAHEALIRKWPTLRAWIDEDRAGLLVQRRVKQAAQLWDTQRRDDSLLFRGAQLAQATEWRKTRESRLGDVDRSFLDASEALKRKQDQEATARLRQTRIVAALLAVLFVGAAVAGVLAIRNAAEAKTKAAESRATLLVALAQNVKADPTAVTPLLREPGHQASTLWTQSALDALQTGIAEVVLRGHEDFVRSVAFSPDGKKIVTGSFDHTARVWNADGSGDPLPLKGHEESVIAVAFSPDGTKIVTGSEDKTARVWNAERSGDPLPLKGHEESVVAVAFSPDGRKIVTGGTDKTVRIWNADGSGAPVVLQGHERFVLAVAFSPDGRKIVTGGFDKIARIWNVDGSGDPVVLQGHKESVVAVAFSPDGTKVVTGSADKTARIWNADGTGAPLVFDGHEDDVYSVAFSPDGKKIVTGSFDHTARVWKADRSGAPLVLKGHNASVLAVAFSPDGTKIVTGSEDKTARVWNADGSGDPRVLQGHEESVLAVAFSPDGRKIVTGSADKTARVWNADGSGAPVVLQGPEASVAAVAFSPDGKKIVTGSWDKTARVWNADGSGDPLPLKGHEASVAAVAFSPDGTKIVTGSWDKTARIWNADGSGALRVLQGHMDFVAAVAFSPDGTKIVTGGKDKTARVWNADRSGDPLVLQGHEESVKSVAFSPDGKKIVTGSWDKTARVWNAGAPEAPLVLKGHASSVVAVAFSPDGTKIVTGSDDNTVRIWTVGSDLLVEALWNATSDCLPEHRRQELLAESPAEAKQGYARCRQEVARRRGWAAP